MRVFARKGYHTCRVGDIAEEAGVAHGLLYHYFRSKEELLETIFRETWRDVLDAVRSVEETDESARDRLAGDRQDPAARVAARPGPRARARARGDAQLALQQRIDEIDAAFAGLERIIARGQAEGEFRSDLDPRMASYVFYGAIEEILTGWVLGQLEDGDEAIARAEETVFRSSAAGSPPTAKPPRSDAVTQVTAEAAPAVGRPSGGASSGSSGPARSGSRSRSRRRRRTCRRCCTGSPSRGR